MFFFTLCACNCNLENGQVINPGINTTVFTGVHFADNNFHVNRKDKNNIKVSVYRIDTIALYQNVSNKHFDAERHTGSGMFLSKDNEYFNFLTAGHVINIENKFPLIKVEISEENGINILKRMSVRIIIWVDDKKENVVFYPLDEINIKVISNDYSKDYGILQLPIHKYENYHISNVPIATTENLEEGNFLYCFSFPSSMGKYLSTGNVTNIGIINEDYPATGYAGTDKMFMMSNEITFGSSGGPIFAIGREDGKLYLVGIVTILIRTRTIIFHIGTRIDLVVKALQEE
jgi:hypothetical protein